MGRVCSVSRSDPSRPTSHSKLPSQMEGGRVGAGKQKLPERKGGGYLQREKKRKLAEDEEKSQSRVAEFLVIRYLGLFMDRQFER